MDRTDLRILETLQAMVASHQFELAEKVSLSASPCLRRVRALEEAGIIASAMPLLDPEKLRLVSRVHLDVALDSATPRRAIVWKAAVQTERGDLVSFAVRRDGLRCRW